MVGRLTFDNEKQGPSRLKKELDIRSVRGSKKKLFDRTLWHSWPILFIFLLIKYMQTIAMKLPVFVRKGPLMRIFSNLLMFEIDIKTQLIFTHYAKKKKFCRFHFLFTVTNI